MQSLEAQELTAETYAERSLLGCCLLDGQESFLRAKAAGVTDGSFTRPVHRQIWGAMDRAAGKGMQTSPDAVVMALSECGVAWTDAAEVFRIADSACTTINFKGFVRELRTYELARDLKKAAGNISGIADLRPLDADEMIYGAEKALSRALDWSEEQASSWSSEVMALADADAKGEEEPGAISWGFSDLDRKFQKMLGGNLVVLAALPGVGKSSMARQIAAHHLRNGEKVFYASLEMKRRELARGWAQAESMVSARSVATAHPEERRMFLEAMKSVAAWPVCVIDDFSTYAGTIVARARAEHKKRKLALVIVDHLHQLPEIRNADRNKNANVADTIGNVTKEFKGLAGELDIPVLLLSQFSRDVAKQGRVPQLSDLKSSSSIEQDADKVVFLHRPATDLITNQVQSDTQSAEDRPRFFTQVIQAKGRADGTGDAYLYFRRTVTKFEQISREKDGPGEPV